MPENAIDLFIGGRVINILSDLKSKLKNITFDEIDTMDVNQQYYLFAIASITK